MAYYIMGYELLAYFEVDQEEVEAFIKDSGIDRTNDAEITKWFVHRYEIPRDLPVYYHWNRPCAMHEFITYEGINFIRDDARLTNTRYHRLLEKRIGAPYPSCLHSMYLAINTPKDALKVAAALRQFYGDDPDLVGFAEWLEETARRCTSYEFSC